MKEMPWHSKALELYNSGLSGRQIAKQLGISKTQVNSFLQGIRYSEISNSSEKKGPKTLFIDIECSPVVSHVWSLWNNNVGLNQIEADWHLLSFCAKWKGSEDIIYDDQRYAKDIEDDYNLLEQIWHLLNECNIAVAHNGKSFDVKKINARLLMHGFPKPSPYKIVDTLEIAKRNFAFTSNKLEYLTDKLCSVKKQKHERYPGHVLWSECLKGNKDAFEAMKEYNIIDVLALEELYSILSSWDNSLPNDDVYVDEVLDMSEWEKDGFHYTGLGKYQVYRNKITGQQKRSRVNLLSKEKRNSLLVNVK